MMRGLKDKLAEAGLSLSDKASKNLVMHLGGYDEEEEDHDKPAHVVQVGGHQLTVVTCMKVVGCMIAANGSLSKELDD
eukprot:4404614-Karenia_brevis.AAC.1